MKLTTLIESLQNMLNSTNEDVEVYVWISNYDLPGEILNLSMNDEETDLYIIAK